MPMFIKIFFVIFTFLLLLGFALKFGATWYSLGFGMDNPYNYFSQGLPSYSQIILDSIVQSVMITLQYHVIAWGVSKYNTMQSHKSQALKP